MPQLLIHIGYHKTGTTWLQEILFSKPDYGFVSPWDRERIISDWIRTDPLIFNAKDMRQSYGLQIEQANENGLVPVLSHERLSGYPASGGYDSKNIADKLARVFADARILIIIREQASVIRSYYLQYINDGGILPLKRFLNPPDTYLIRAPLFNFDFFEYDRLIQYYHNLFTPERVLALPFELLKSDQRRFVHEIANYAKVDPPEDIVDDRLNVGTRPIWAQFARIGNLMFLRNQLNPNAIFEKRALSEAVRILGRRAANFAPQTFHELLNKKMNRFIKQKVSDRYRSSNQRVSKLIGLDLSDFGYKL